MEYVNKNTHAAHVKGNDGQLVRLAPGQVVNADGAFADNLSTTPGVAEASSADKKAWEGTAAATETEAAPTPSSLVNDAIVEARAAATKLLAATNQLVIGDDQAPYGPPSGVVTTAQAVKDKEHFAHLSAGHVGEVDGGTAEGKIGGSEVPTSAEVHNSQVERTAAVDDLAKALAGLHGGSDEPADGEGDTYDELSGEELRGELKARDLPTSGKVEELRDRLREADAEEADGEDADGDGDSPGDSQ